MGKYGFSFSWKRATGISAMKSRISRRTGIPLTRSGRRQKVGRALGCVVLLAVGVTAGGLAIAACDGGTPPPPPTPPPTEYDTFVAALRSGADCPMLFELRNGAKRKAPSSEVERMNVELRGVQCFTSTSRRAKAGERDGTFTVREYRLYHGVVRGGGTEAAAIQQLATRYSMKPAAVKAAANKVMGELFNKSWSSTPEVEIRHASDWNGEAP